MLSAGEVNATSVPYRDVSARDVPIDSGQGVYLLHFVDAVTGVTRRYVGKSTSPTKRVQAVLHYTGYADDGTRRIAEHRSGGSSSARMMQVAHADGLSFIVASWFSGQDRSFERMLKNQGGARRHCPVCRSEEV